jgi:hypothetical protein
MTRTQIALSDGQRAQVNAAAATLRYDHRGVFICDVMNILEARTHGRSVTNADVSAAVEAALGVTPTSLFMCDGVSLTKQEATTMSNFDPTMARKVRAQLDDDDFEVVDGTEVLKNGRSIRVPLFQMDAAVDDLQRSVMLDTIERERARRFGLNDSAALHRPGYRFNVSDEARDARAEAHAQYIDTLENAWRAPGAGERGQCEGDTCAINGRRGVLIDLGGGKLCCIADEDGGRDYLRESADAAPTRDHAQNMAEIYAAHDRALEAAWRGKT